MSERRSGRAKREIAYKGLDADEDDEEDFKPSHRTKSSNRPQSQSSSRLKSVSSSSQERLSVADKVLDRNISKAIELSIKSEKKSVSFANEKETKNKELDSKTNISQVVFNDKENKTKESSKFEVDIKNEKILQNKADEDNNIIKEKNCKSLSINNIKIINQTETTEMENIKTLKTMTNTLLVNDNENKNNLDISVSENKNVNKNKEILETNDQNNKTNITMKEDKNVDKKNDIVKKNKICEEVKPITKVTIVNDNVKDHVDIKDDKSKKTHTNSKDGIIFKENNENKEVIESQKGEKSKNNVLDSKKVDNKPSTSGIQLKKDRNISKKRSYKDMDGDDDDDDEEVEFADDDDDYEEEESSRSKKFKKNNSKEVKLIKSETNKPINNNKNASNKPSIKSNNNINNTNTNINKNITKQSIKTIGSSTIKAPSTPTSLSSPSIPRCSPSSLLAKSPGLRLGLSKNSKIRPLLGNR